MDHRELEHYLRRHDVIEAKQRYTRRNINEFGGKELILPHGEQFPRMPESFFSIRAIIISASTTGSPPCQSIRIHLSS